MGRGRAKAKQTKVARDLKYRTHETDFGALARELHGDSDSDSDDGDTGEDDSGGTDTGGTDESTDEYDEWSDYVEQSRD
jgi:hypothetical protein